MESLPGPLRAAIRLGTALIVVWVLLRAFLIDVYTVPHNGMAPTLIYGDEVAVLRHASVDFTNIVLCQHPTRPDDVVIGRAIAFAGHLVSTDRFGYLQVDDDRTATEGRGPMTFYDALRDRHMSMGLGEIQYGQQKAHRTHATFIEQGHVFRLQPYQVNRGVYLLGDNRSDLDNDSRAFGEVDPETCKGQVFLRLRPAPKTGDDIDHGYFDLIK